MADSGGSPLPDVSPQLATLAASAPVGDEWLHEIKFDGYRLLCRIEAGRARLISRNAKDWSAKFGEVIEGAETLPVTTAILDGEVAIVRPDGRTSFQDLQNAAAGSSHGGVLRYFLFDLLYLDGRDLRSEPLTARKAALNSLLGSVDLPVLHYSDHVLGNGPSFYKQACGFELEGIVSKKADSPYRPGRSRDWLKIKCLKVEEFVVGGFTEPGGSRHGFGAFLVGGHDQAGALRYAGRVGTGLTDRQLREFADRLAAIEQPESPFADGPEGRAARAMHWVRPDLVIRVAYAECTDDGLLRHPSFQGLRDDMSPLEVMHPLAERWTDTVAGDDSDPIESVGSPLADQPSSAGDDVESVDGGRSRPVPKSTSSRSGGNAEGSPAPPSRRTSRKKSSLEVEGIPITNPDKVLYPGAGVTKRELVEHYARVAHHMLPWVGDRPLTLVRCPNGIADCFYQKHIEGTVPDAILRVPVREDDEQGEYAAVDSAAGLVALSQLGVLEIHTWGSRRDDLERPDRFTLDFDPDPDVPWIRVVEAALEARGFLGELGLDSFLKTTGGKGLHVVVPIMPDGGWPEIKEFSRRVAAAIAFDNPGKYTLSLSKEKRKGRILIDYLRNGRGATAVEAFSTRARPGAPVAMPIRWEELADGVKGDTFNVRNVADRLDSLTEDPWSGWPVAERQRITPAMQQALHRE